MKKPECIFPHLSTTHSPKRDYAALRMHLFGTVPQSVFAAGLLPGQRYGVALSSLVPAHRTGVTPPSRRAEPPAPLMCTDVPGGKIVFSTCTSRAWHTAAQRNTKVSAVTEKLMMGSLPSPSSFPLPKQKHGNHRIGPGLKESRSGQVRADR